MKKLAGLAIGAAAAANLSNEEWLMIIGILVTIFNILYEYLKSKEEKKK